MPRTRTLAQLVTSARQRADEERTGFVGAAEAREMVNGSVAFPYWNNLVTADRDRYVATSTFTSVNGTLEYSLEDDFYQIVRVDLVDAGERCMLDRFDLTDPTYTASDSEHTWLPHARTSLRYTVRSQGQDGADTVLLFDRNPGAHTFFVHYVLAPPDLTADDDEIDFVAGWEEVVILDTAIKMVTKANLPTDGLERQLARSLEQLRASASIRDSGRAPRVVDVRTSRSLLRYPRAR